MVHNVSLLFFFEQGRIRPPVFGMLKQHFRFYSEHLLQKVQLLK